MNTYRNKRTGAEVVTESTVTGGDWEPVKPKKEPKGKGKEPDTGKEPEAGKEPEGGEGQ